MVTRLIQISCDGTEEQVTEEALAVGDRLRFKPGEKIPPDGTIREDSSSIDKSLITGEPLSVTKATPGDFSNLTSLAYGPDGQPAISCRDATNFDLKFARMGVFTPAP